MLLLLLLLLGRVLCLLRWWRTRMICLLLLGRRCPTRQRLAVNGRIHRERRRHVSNASRLRAGASDSASGTCASECSTYVYDRRYPPPQYRE